MFNTKNIKLDSYKNELETMRYLRSQKQLQDNRVMTMLWLQTADEPKIAEEMRLRSTSLRLEGNNIFKKDEAEEIAHPKLLAACRLFTDALLCAPFKSEERAKAHANRGSVLQQFGYYQQAYDDNQYARQQGYPKQLLHKVILRQAYCSRYMGNVDRLRFHLNELRDMPLSETFRQEVVQLNEFLQELLAEDQRPKTIFKRDQSLHRQTQGIETSRKFAMGRYMVAKAPINENELIFRERAASFVPVRDGNICHNCISKLLIPFPCPRCENQVLYCSIKCSNAHACTHSFECMGYVLKIFSRIGVAHLAFRIMIDELPMRVNCFRSERTANVLWKNLFKVNKSGYGKILQLVSHMNKMGLEEIKTYGLVADLLTTYLKDFTNFFDFAKDTAASRDDWHLIVASLILRHIGQSIVNGTTISAPAFISGFRHKYKFPLLADIWERPQHLKRGYLHAFAHFEEIATANFPYLSLCNHACVPSFQTRFSGRYVSTIAARKLEIGDEINNSYTLDWRQASRQTRRSDLMLNYHFVCECKKCLSDNPDEDFQKFHRYRCQNKKCGTAFVPDTKYINWWKQDGESFKPQNPFKCTACGALQPTKFLTKISGQLNRAKHNDARMALYEHWKVLDAVLLDNNELKQDLGFKVVKKVFALHMDGMELNQNDYNALLDILNFFLRAVAEQSGTNRIEYAVYMTFLWDIAAMGKYLFTVEESESMLGATEILPDEFKMIFLNYYEDYIKPRLMD